MNDKVLKIWKTFCRELIDGPTEDQAKALASAIREIALEFSYYQCCIDEGVSDMVIDMNTLYEIADELDDKDMENYGGNTPIVPDDTMEKILKNGVRK